MKTIHLEPATIEVMREWNLKHYGRGVGGPATVTDPENVARIEAAQLPGETLNETIRRLFREERAN